MNINCKKIISVILTVVVVLTAAPLSGFVGVDLNLFDFSTTSSALAETGKCGNNITYTFDSSKGILTLSGTGNMTYSYNTSYKSPFKNNSNIYYVVIENGISSIGVDAFNSCSRLKEVTIPSSITSISKGAFYGCTDLNKVNISSIEAWCKISFQHSYSPDDSSNPLYYAQNLYLNNELLSDLIIPNSTTSIGNDAFYNCNSITSVTIPDSIKSIGSYAFYNCNSITSVTIPDSVESIDSFAFKNCCQLANISLPCNNMNIGYEAFLNTEFYNVQTNWNNDVLYIDNHIVDARETISGDLVINEGTKSIAYAAFDNCSKLKSVVIPDSITGISGSAFSGCSGLVNVTIPDSITEVGNNAFYGCTGLLNISLPESITSIGNYAFVRVANISYNGSASGSPWGARSINGYIEYPLVFSDSSKTELLACTSSFVGELIMPDSITTVGNNTFYHCSNITSLTIGNNVATIGSYSFYHCSGLSEIDIPDSVTELGQYSFYQCENLQRVALSNNIQSIKSGSFSGCELLNNIVIPKTVKSIESSAFYNVPNITLNSSSVSYSNYPWGARTVNGYVEDGFIYKNSSKKALNVCLKTNNGSLQILDCVETINEKAFSGCNEITSIIIPNSVINIDKEAFSGCSGLTELSIPDSVKYVGEKAFYNCSGITSVLIGSGIERMGSNVFEGCCNLNEVEVKDGARMLGNYTFAGCYNLTDISLPDSLWSLGTNSFFDTAYYRSFFDNYNYETSNLAIYINNHLIFAYTPIATEFTVRDGTKTISNINWNNYTNPAQLYLPDGLIGIGSGSFYGNFESISIPDTVKYIGSHAFDSTTAVSSGDIVIPDGVRYYDDEALSGFNYFSKISFPKDLVYVGSNAFANCEGLVDVVVKPADDYSSVNISYSAFDGCNISLLHFYGTEEELYSSPYYINARTIHYLEHISSPATCLDVGYEYDFCQDCDTRFNYVEYPKIDHKYDDGTVVEPTCSEQGYTLHHCTMCNKEYRDNYTDKIPHNFVETVIDKTCTKDGFTIFICQDCMYSYKGNYVSATGHDYDETVVPPTCQSKGKTIHTCKYCGDTYYDNETEIVNHCYVENVVLPTCKTKGFTVHTCKYCNDSYTDSFVEATGHQYTSVVVNPTCTDEGYTINTCDTCGEYAITDKVAPLGHDYYDKVTKPTCEEDGYTTHICTRGDSIYEDNIVPALGHDYEPTVIHTTCIQEGCTLNICNNCGRVTKTDEQPAFGHTFGEWRVIKNAGLNSEGLEERVCKDCGYTEERTIAMTEKTSYTASFVADGKLVSTVEFLKGTKAIVEPDVPQKDRYKGHWEDYTLNDSDITINAVYEIVSLNNISGVENEKNISYNAETGIANIDINVSSPGKTIITQTKKQVPLDIVLVIDQSGSMNDYLGGYESKIDALADSANGFVNNVYNEAVQNNVDHRIAVVGFGMGNNSMMGYPAFLNTEILSTGGRAINYNRATADNYHAALQPVNKNGQLNESIVNAINAIDANGATAADYGLAMASNIFANNPINENETRERIVVFMTDGEPTYGSSFSVDVANSAIQKANEIKNTYNATIYSVGIMSNSEANNNKLRSFMNRVSSNYSSTISLFDNTDSQYDNFYIQVNNTDKLTSVFRDIVTENVTRTSDFDDVTIIETISKYFTLTSQQEKELRVTIIETYGLNNSDIKIFNNDDGTTTIIIKGLHPKETNDGYNISFDFNVSSNQHSNVAGVYNVDTEDSGIIIGDNNTYEAIFDVDSVTIPENKYTAVFKINGTVYSISCVKPNESVLTPETSFLGEYEFSGWNISDDYLMSNEYEEFDSDLVTQKYVVIWNTEQGKTSVSYHPGDLIDIPVVPANSNGVSFKRWNGIVPILMPDHSIEYTAVYGDHEHQYKTEVVSEMTCLTNGIIKYTCDVCGDSYSEEITCIGHHTWKAIAGPADGNNHSHSNFICEQCGQYSDRSLDYIMTDNQANERGHYNAIIHEFNYIDQNGNNHQPDDEITIVSNVNEYFSNADNVIVYRLDDNGNRILCNSEYTNGVLIFDTNHFSTYMFEPVFTCQSTGEHDDLNNDGYCDRCDSLIEDYKDFILKTGIEAYIDEENNVLIGNDVFNSSAKTIKQLFEFGNISVLNKTTEKIGTGDILCLTNSQGSVCSQLTIVIYGDINGDGIYDGQDSFIVNCIANGMLTREQIGEAKWMAADCNHDGEINAADVAILEQAGLLLSQVDQTMSQDELMETQSYQEYLNLIDQNPDADETPIEEPSEPEAKSQTIIDKIIEMVKYIISIIRSVIKF